MLKAVAAAAAADGPGVEARPFCLCQQQPLLAKSVSSAFGAPGDGCAHCEWVSVLQVCDLPLDGGQLKILCMHWFLVPDFSE